MKAINFTQCFLVAGTFLFFASVAASTEWSSEVRALRFNSAQNEFGGKSVPVLNRLPGPGNATTLQRTLQVVNMTGLSKGLTAPAPTMDGESVIVRTEKWMIHVAGDGRHVRFSGNKGDQLPASQGLPHADVMKLGKRALENELSLLVPLASNEQLVPLMSQDGMLGSAKPGWVMTQQVFESRAHFGRSVDGIAVVGPGSRAVVSFDCKGNLVGFEIDWSQFAPAGTVQTTYSAAVRNNRLAALQYHGLLASGAQLKYVECGYYDAGTLTHTKAATTLIQPGCLYRFDHASNGLSFGHEIVAVPTGGAFVSDPGWPESVALTVAP